MPTGTLPRPLSRPSPLKDSASVPDEQGLSPFFSPIPFPVALPTPCPQAYEQLGKNAEAIADLEVLLQQQPGNAEAKLFLDRLAGKKPSPNASSRAKGGESPTAVGPTTGESNLNSNHNDSKLNGVHSPDLSAEEEKKKGKKKKKKKSGEPDDDAEDLGGEKSGETRDCKEGAAEDAEYLKHQAMLLEQLEEEKRLEEERERLKQKKEKEKAERLRKEREERERKEREKREKKEREDKERRDREEKERKEREERELARRIREKERKEQKERQERERKQREERERKEKEKAEREKREREKREREERERKEKEERERKEKEEKERKEKEEKERRERLRKEREKEERLKKEKEERLKKEKEKEERKQRELRERQQREQEQLQKDQKKQREQHEAREREKGAQREREEAERREKEQSGKEKREKRDKFQWDTAPEKAASQPHPPPSHPSKPAHWDSIVLEPAHVSPDPFGGILGPNAGFEMYTQGHVGSAGSSVGSHFSGANATSPYPSPNAPSPVAADPSPVSRGSDGGPRQASREEDDFLSRFGIMSSAPLKATPPVQQPGPPVDSVPVPAPAAPALAPPGPGPAALDVLQGSLLQPGPMEAMHSPVSHSVLNSCAPRGPAVMPPHLAAQPSPSHTLFETQGGPMDSVAAARAAGAAARGPLLQPAPGRSALDTPAMGYMPLGPGLFDVAGRADGPLLHAGADTKALLGEVAPLPGGREGDELDPPGSGMGDFNVEQILSHVFESSAFPSSWLPPPAAKLDGGAEVQVADEQPLLQDLGLEKWDQFTQD